MPLVTPSAGSKQVASVHVDIGADTTKFEKGSASVKAGVVSIGQAMGVLTTAVSVAVSAFNFSKEGAELQRLADAGAEVARQYGGNMDLIIQKVKEASLGTVSEMDIIAASNRAMLLGLSADADQLANLMEVAALRGRAMGVDTTKAFNDIVTGVGRASPLILDNLGIVVNAKETYAKYAESIGKSAEQLTKAEKTQALMNAVLDEGNKMLKEAGGLALDNAGKVEKLEASWKNFTDNRKRENEDFAGSLADSFSTALDGWDEYFKFISNRSEIVDIAREMANSAGDGSGNWAKYWEKARLEWAIEQQSIAKVNTELEVNAELARIAAEELNNLSKSNAILIDGAIDITERNKDYEKSQQDILDRIAETRAEGEKLYPWEHEKIQENIDKLDELGEKYFENRDKFMEAQNEKLAMMAIEQIALSDGIEGFSQAEYEKAKVILETQDIATAAAFEEQQAMTLLAQAVADGIIPVEEWGEVLDSVMSDGVVSVDEVSAAIQAVPKENTVTFNIVTNGQPPNLDPTAAKAPVGTHRSSGGRASGGGVNAGSMYEVLERGVPELLMFGGKQMLMMPQNSGGFVSPLTAQSTQSNGFSPSDMNRLISTMQSNKTDERKLARYIVNAMAQGG